MTTNLILVRHGQTQSNKKGRLQGLTDSPLTPTGIAAAEKVGHILQIIPIKHAYCSDSQRTKMTAQTILKAADQVVPLEEVSFLREYNFGNLEGVTYRHIFMRMVHAYGLQKTVLLFNDPKRFLGFINALHQLDPTHQAESYQEVKERLLSGFGRLLNRFEVQDGNILVVSHGLVLSTFIYLLDPTQVPQRLIKNTGVSIVQYHQGDCQVQLVNSADRQQIRAKLQI
ncbi:histidine phosphatase family protein [Lactobacillus sp. CC-MHH1034]|uniref:histidine phosphatase family protein n=1 Tax=Agrilactobacillus fermenti TaxID=2586909 RepID=UPI001E5B336A|nr:histidine phosphatase family protein [Agrilactobacillus fermenti]MCD2257132.1 histidine phosphatase family protein [Agrilactobacillus fermenti]